MKVLPQMLTKTEKNPEKLEKVFFFKNTKKKKKTLKEYSPGQPTNKIRKKQQQQKKNKTRNNYCASPSGARHLRQPTGRLGVSVMV